MSTVAQAKSITKVLFDADVAIYWHGPPGVGKSDGISQLSKELKIGFKDIRLGQMDTPDMIGWPYRDAKDDRTKFSRPEFWPDEARDGKEGILLLDEMSDAPRAIQSAAYQLVLNRQIGPHRLPRGWVPIAAGNRREDRAAAQAISTALANRFAHVDISADLDTWVTYAYGKDVHELITGFLRFRPELLHSMNGADLRAFPTPRSWMMLDRVIKDALKMGKADRILCIQSMIGEGPATELAGYIDVVANLPDIDEILRNPARVQVPASLSAKWAVTQALARRSNKGNLKNVWTYAKRLGTEFEIVTMLDATRLDSDLVETTTYIDFANSKTDLRV